MMRFLVIALSLLSSFFSYAQNKPFEQVLGWKGRLSVKSIADSAKKSTCVTVENNSKLKAFLFDKEMHFVKDFELEIADEDVIGGFIQANLIQLYLNPGGEGLIHNITIDTRTGDARDTIFQLELKGEKLMGHLNAANSFLYITASKKTPIFHVYRFGGTNMEQISFDLRVNNLDKNFTDGNLWAALSTASGLSRSADIAIVDPEAEADVDAVSSHNKLYLLNNKLALVMDMSGEKVLVLNFDLTSKQADCREIKRPFRAVAPEEFNRPEYNSFLIGNQLYSVEASAESLSLVIQDFQTGKILKSYKALEDETISFKNTPIIQEGGATMYAPSERNLEKTKQLLRKMLNGNAVITVAENNKGQHELTIGAYKKVTQRSGGFAPSMGGGGMAAGGAMIFVNPGFNSSWTRVVRFRSLVDPATSSHIPGDMQVPVGEEIRKYTESMKISATASSVLIANKFHQFAYYDKTEKKLVVMRFE